jgi:putative acetyltransferase
VTRLRDDLLIRAVADTDHDALTEIFNQRSVAAQTLQIPYTTTAERRERFGNRPDLRVLVAEIDGRVVGEGSLMLYTRRRAHVGSIGMSVHEQHQGQGIGGAIIRALLDLADNWYNLRRIELQVYTDNEPGIRLYERHGFVVEGTHRAYAFREGHLVSVYSMARVRDDPPPITPPATRPARDKT